MELEKNRRLMSDGAQTVLELVRQSALQWCIKPETSIRLRADVAKANWSYLGRVHYSGVWNWRRAEGSGHMSPKPTIR